MSKNKFGEGEFFIKKYIYLAASPKGGYGVYTKNFICKDTIVEISPTLPITLSERSYLKTLLLYDFNIDEKNTCISLGYGSLYNHNKDYNVDYIYDNINSKMIFKTIKDILPHEELFIHYGPHYFTLNKIDEI